MSFYICDIPNLMNTAKVRIPRRFPAIQYIKPSYLQQQGTFYRNMMASL